MSIVSKIAKFVIRSVLAGLAREAAQAERKVAASVAKRDRKVAKLDKEIIARSKCEDSEIAKIRAKAEAEIANIRLIKHRKIEAKHAVRWNCGTECRELDKKAHAALELKSKLEAVVK